MSRIKFYSTTDLSRAWSLERIEKFIELYKDNKELDVNDILEYSNICQFINADVWLLTWSEEYIQKLKEIGSELWAKIVAFFKAISEENFLEISNKIEKEYQKDYLKLFVKFGLEKRIKGSTIKQALDIGIFDISAVLEFKIFSDVYAEEIKTVLLSDVSNAEIIIDKCIPFKNEYRYSPEIYLPKSLTKQSMEELILHYIDSSEPNPNYLKVISTYNNSNALLTLKPETKYKANKKYKELIEMMFSDSNSTVGFETSIKFVCQDNIIEANIEGFRTSLSYDTKWIIDNLDYPTILNNFIYLFEYVDGNFRINLVSSENDISTMERLFSHFSVTDYLVSSVFSMKNSVANLQLIGYSEILKRHGWRVEDSLIYFYLDHCEEIYGICGFSLSLPDPNISNYEKCKSIAPEIEAIASQFKVYVELGYINHEYISQVANGITFLKIPSLISKKYVYEKDQSLRNLMMALFSDQAIINYVNDIDEENFVNLITKHSIYYDDFKHYQLPLIDLLVQAELIKVQSNRLITINNKWRVIILRELYIAGYMNYHWCPDEMKNEIERMVHEQLLIFDSTLLSKQEASYFNYVLNNSQFGNSLGLRNKYLHGSARKNDEDSFRDYITLLKMLILLTIKINDDLELGDRFGC